MTIEVTFEMNVPLDGPLEQVVSSVMESVNKIYEAYQGKVPIRIVVKIAD